MSRALVCDCESVSPHVCVTQGDLLGGLGCCLPTYHSSEARSRPLRRPLGLLTTATARPTDPEASSSHGKLESACIGISPSSPDLTAMPLMATKTARMPTALNSAADPDIGVGSLQAEPGGIIPHRNRDMGGTDRRTESRDKGFLHTPPANRQTCRRACGPFLILRTDNAIHNLLQATAGEDAREMPKSHPKWIVCGLPWLFLA